MKLKADTQVKVMNGPHTGKTATVLKVQKYFSIVEFPVEAGADFGETAVVRTLDLKPIK